MEVVGMHGTIGKDGKRSTTLQVLDKYNGYYQNEEAGRWCVGMKVESIYVGDYDCSHLEVGMEIEILYDKAITTSRGTTFQPIKRIEVVEN